MRRLCANPKCEWHNLFLVGGRTELTIVDFSQREGGGRMVRERIGGQWFCECCASAIKVALDGKGGEYDEL